MQLGGSGRSLVAIKCTTVDEGLSQKYNNLFAAVIVTGPSKHNKMQETLEHAERVVESVVPGLAPDSRTIHLLDYAAGNVRSLVNAIEKLGWQVQWVKSPEDVQSAEV